MMYSLGKAKSERALELLDKVITKATKAMIKSKKEDDKDLNQRKLEDMANCVKVKYSKYRYFLSCNPYNIYYTL